MLPRYPWFTIHTPSLLIVIIIQFQIVLTCIHTQIYVKYHSMINDDTFLEAGDAVWKMICCVSWWNFVPFYAMSWYLSSSIIDYFWWDFSFWHFYSSPLLSLSYSFTLVSLIHFYSYSERARLARVWKMQQ